MTVTTPEEHATALAELDTLMSSAVKGTPEADRLKELAIAISNYERLHYPITPVPVPEIIRRLRAAQVRCEGADAYEEAEAVGDAIQVFTSAWGAGTVRRTMDGHYFILSGPMPGETTGI